MPLRRVLLLLLAGLSLLGLFMGCGSTADGGDANAAREGDWIPGLKGVESGEIEAALSISGTREGDQLYMRLLGMFLGAGEGKAPRVDGIVEATGQMDGEKVDGSVSLITGPHRAAVTYGGTVYEMAPEVFDPIRSSFERALGDGTAADPYACLEAAAGIDVSRIAGRTTERDPDATANDGSKVTSVTTKLEPSTLRAALHELIEDPGCGAQLGVARPLRGELEKIVAKFEAGVQEGEVETFVDKAGLLRELRVHAVLGSKGEGESEANFVYSVSHVNEITELPPCTGEKPIEALFRALGFNPLKAMEAGQPGLRGLLEGFYALPLA